MEREERGGVSELPCDYSPPLSGLYSAVYGMWCEELLTGWKALDYSFSRRREGTNSLHLPSDFPPDFTLNLTSFPGFDNAAPSLGIHAQPVSMKVGSFFSPSSNTASSSLYEVGSTLTPGCFPPAPVKEASSPLPEERNWDLKTHDLCTCWSHSLFPSKPRQTYPSGSSLCTTSLWRYCCLPHPSQVEMISYSFVSSMCLTALCLLEPLLQLLAHL